VLATAALHEGTMVERAGMRGQLTSGPARRRSASTIRLRQASEPIGRSGHPGGTAGVRVRDVLSARLEPNVGRAFRFRATLRRTAVAWAEAGQARQSSAAAEGPPYGTTAKALP
jgi:hypothetical protein